MQTKMQTHLVLNTIIKGIRIISVWQTMDTNPESTDNSNFVYQVINLNRGIITKKVRKVRLTNTVIVRAAAIITFSGS
ncbi:UNKNOWN [Stylonychia lemnae]|uniref:Uncharacterized protein n=1 Tax=Stylonychia lemnae TaxID=5949 RepID=A0A078A7A1_STYLE|nr:UNKNOWN [Stylonychia lemnae]|eukprot:CDW77407.1 UNKNOWN [Stylonychia lemnae]